MHHSPNENGTGGRSCTRTVNVLDVVPLLLGQGVFSNRIGASSLAGERLRALGQRCARWHGPAAHLHLARLGRAHFPAHAAPIRFKNTPCTGMKLEPSGEFAAPSARYQRAASRFTLRRRKIKPHRYRRPLARRRLAGREVRPSVKRGAAYGRTKVFGGSGGIRTRDLLLMRELRCCCATEPRKI